MSTELTTSQGAFEGTKEALVKDLKGVVANADDMLKEVANSTAEGFAVARTKIEARLDAARSRLDDARIAVRQKARGAADATHEYVRENPWKLLCVAAAAGLVIGFLLSRR